MQIFNGNFYAIKQMGFFAFFGIILGLIVSFLLNILLTYGLIACITASRQDEKITFLTLFKKIRKHGFKALKTSLLIQVKILVWLLMLFVTIMICNKLYSIPIVATVLPLASFLIVLYKLLELSFTSIFANFLVFDYPSKPSKKIIGKAEQITKRQSCTFTIVMLWVLISIIPLIALEVILTNVDLLIWEPYIEYYWSIPILVESSAPTWWSILVGIIGILIGMYVLLKALITASSFYESLEPVYLFSYDFEIKKEKFSRLFGAFGLLVTFIVAILLISNGWDAAFSKLSKLRYPEEEKPTVNASVENIELKTVGITDDGELVVKITNKDEKIAYIDKVKAKFKTNNTSEELSASPSSFYIEPNKDMYVYFYSYVVDFENDKKYQNYDLNVEMEDLNGYMFSNPTIYDGEITIKETSDSIIIKFDEKLKNVYTNIVFFNDGKPVKISNNTYNSTTIIDEKTTYLISNIPTLNYFSDEKIEYDKYEVRLYHAQKATQSSKATKNIDTNILGLSDDNKVLVELKNNDTANIHLESVHLILSDKNNNLVDIIEMHDSDFQILSDDTIFSFFELDSDIDNFKKLKTSFVYTLDDSFFAPNFLEEELEIKCSDKDEEIEVEIKNTFENELTSIKVNVVFYKDKKAVGFSSGTKSWTDIAPGETTIIEIEPPEDIEYDNFTADVLRVLKSSD